MNSQRPTTARPNLVVPRAEAESQITAELEKWRALLSQPIQTRQDFKKADADISKLRRYTHEVLLSLFDSDKISNEFGGNLGTMRSGNESVAELTADLKRVCTFSIHDLESILERLRFFAEPNVRSADGSAPGILEVAMGFDAKVFNVLIASPSDVGDERDAVERTIYKWNSEHGEHESVMLQPRRWEIDTRPDMNDAPQAVVNKQLVDKCDLLLGVFWTRLGTPTGEAASGTVEEVNRFLKTGRPVMLYFSEKPIPPKLLDAEQYRRLKEFKADIQEKGLIETFEDAAALSEKVERHVMKWVRELGATKAFKKSESGH